MQTTFGIFVVFLRLGLTSFGGPISHIGYFRAEFVTRREWITDETYAGIVALSQFVPGPASSQTGFALGLLRGGLPGGIAAWVGFTLPSALLMFAAAYGLQYAGGGAAQGILHGLKLLAAAVVAQALWVMGRSLCPDARRAGFAFAIAALLIAFSKQGLQLAAIFAGAVFGLCFLDAENRDFASTHGIEIGRPAASFMAIGAFFALWVGLPLAAEASGNGSVTLFEAFYRTGALVFGGGHVVLPLLQESVVKPGWVSGGDFLAGYGAAQALPGPLFTFSAFLGAKAAIGPGGSVGACLALIAIFLPGLLLIYGVLPFWDRLRTRRYARGALGGVNAAVVGVLGAALYDPIGTSTIVNPIDASFALLALAALAIAKLPVLLVVALSAGAGAALTLFPAA